jgi:L-iditol 2-dehydrogenase
LACVVHWLEIIDWRGVESVLVLGLGAMGLLFAQFLPRYTRATLAGAGRRPARLELARRLGLAPVIDVTQEEVPALFDCVIECTGTLGGWQSAFERTGPGGQVLLFGGLPRDTVFGVDSYRVHYEEVRILGSFHFSPRDVARAREYLLTGAIDPGGLISETLPLDRLCEALERLQAGDGIQYAIDPWA